MEATPEGEIWLLKTARRPLSTLLDWKTRVCWDILRAGGTLVGMVCTVGGGGVGGRGCTAHYTVHSIIGLAVRAFGGGIRALLLSNRRLYIIGGMQVNSGGFIRGGRGGFLLFSCLPARHEHRQNPLSWQNLSKQASGSSPR